MNRKFFCYNNESYYGGIVSKRSVGNLFLGRDYNMNTKKLIGVFGTEVSARIQGNLYTEIHRMAISRGYQLVLFSGSFDVQLFNETSQASCDLFSLAEHMEFAAFLIHAQSIKNPDFIEKIIDMGKRKQIPIFLYDGEATGIAKREGIISIDPDYKQGFADSVRHLIEHHHCRNIFMLAGMRNNKYSDDRIEMYRREMESHGIEYCEEQIGYGNFWEGPAKEAVNRFLDSGLPTPEAICCANDTMALTAVNVLRERGLRVPEDVLVTGFDCIEDGKYNYPSISTCEPNMEAVAEFIFRVLRGEEHADSFLIPLLFTAKDSCGCGMDNILESKMEMPRLFDSMRVNTWQHQRLAIMQFQVMDSCVLEDVAGHIQGVWDLFKSYGHLLCFRQDIESNEEYRDPFDSIKVFMNRNLLPEQEYDPFASGDILPDWDKVTETMAAEDMLIFRLLQSGDKKYGYYVTRAGYYSSNELRNLEQFQESLTIAIECILRNMRLKVANQKLSVMYERISEIYIRDTMTGLFNRHGYYQVLEEYLKREDLKDGYLHVISIDMDGMKTINDNYGHLEGDHAIQSVAHAINVCFAQPCISARFGGDEFVVAIFTEKENEPANEKLSCKLNNYLKNSPMLADKEYEVGVSVGQAVVKLAQIGDLKSIEKAADDCMYMEKRKRKNRRKE